MSEKTREGDNIILHQKYLLVRMFNEIPMSIKRSVRFHNFGTGLMNGLCIR